jgi:hypothetical protein
LLPIPFLDLVLEAIFRHRIAPTIATRRGVEVAPAHLLRLGRGGGLLTVRGCLLLPVKAALWVLKRVFRKLVYVLSVADAASALSAYWHRAHLVDHILRQGHLETHGEAALRAFARTVEQADTSPLTGLARQAIGNVHRVLGLLLEARRGEARRVRALLQGLETPNREAVERSLARYVSRYEEARVQEVEP